MNIHFPHERPEYCARDLVIAFPAEIGGVRVQCVITAETLEDHFGAASLREDDLIAAFDIHRYPIEQAGAAFAGRSGRQAGHAAPRLLPLCD